MTEKILRDAETGVKSDRDLQLSLIAQKISHQLALAWANHERPGPAPNFHETAEALVMEQGLEQRAWAELRARGWVRRLMVAEAKSIAHRAGRHWEDSLTMKVADWCLSELINALTRAETPNVVSETLSAYRHGLVTPKGNRS